MNNFFKYKNNVALQKGCLLLSEPYLHDPNFDRTVILLCEHNDEGSFGLVVNKLSNVLFSDAIEDVGRSRVAAVIIIPYSPNNCNIATDRYRSTSIAGWTP